MTENNSSSLQNHCTTCRARCCHGSHVIATEEEHKKIATSGAPDYFTRIPLPEGNYYMLDYAQGACAYLTPNGCSIEQVKPDTCKMYPAQIYRNTKGQFIGVAFDNSCPAYKFLTEEFKEMAEHLATEFNNKVPGYLRKKITNVYDHL